MWIVAAVGAAIAVLTIGCENDGDLKPVAMKKGSDSPPPPTAPIDEYKLYDMPFKPGRIQ